MDEFEFAAITTANQFLLTALIGTLENRSPGIRDLLSTCVDAAAAVIDPADESTHAQRTRRAMLIAQEMLTLEPPRPKLSIVQGKSDDTTSPAKD